MKTEDYQFVAEALLAICEKDRDRPFHTERAMDIKLRRERENDPLALDLARKAPDDPLLAHECDEIVTLARLTRRQTEVMQLRLRGFTFDEIGEGRCHSKQGAQRVFIQALKKIIRAFRMYPYSGLADVYRWEVRRGR